jgi:hypothetical protein
MGVTDIGEIPIASGWRILCGPKNARYPPHAGVSDTPRPICVIAGAAKQSTSRHKKEWIASLRSQ